MPSIVPELPSEERAWLMTLGKEIWVIHTDPSTHRRHADKRRELTQEEFNRVVKLIHDFDLVCEMESAFFGFDVGIRVYAHTVVPLTEPEMLVFVTGTHLPESVERSDRLQTSFFKAWSVFEPLVARESNKQFLAYYKLDPLRDQEHYRY